MNTTTSAPTSECECEYNEYYSISTCRKLNEFICAPITRHLIPIQEQFENVSNIKQLTVALSLSLSLSVHPPLSLSLVLNVPNLTLMKMLLML